ncbi:MAG: ABC transporter permease [Lachnospiraceae bacterium]|jgi:ABC-2 type transport system permease protein|nr:ABC transporter permease [Lachnospiraceae bacterium]
MPVFRLYLKITKSRLGFILMYICISLLIAFILIKAIPTQTSGSFSDSKVPVGIVDRDHSTLSKELIKYVKSKQPVHMVTDSKKVMEDEIYYGTSSYILIIPKGLEKSFANKDGNILDLQNLKTPNSSDGAFVDNQINSYITSAKAYWSSGLTIKGSCEKTAETMKVKGKTSILGSDNNSTNKISPLYYYIYILPYPIICILIIVLGTTLLRIYQPEVKKKNYASAMPLKKFNLQIILGSFTITLGIFAILSAIGIILFHKTLGNVNLGYVLLNLFIFTLTALAIGVFCGFVSNSLNALSGLSNVIGLSFCFLGGVFIEQSVLNPKILPISKLLPTYYFINNNDLVFFNTSLSHSNLMTYFSNCGMQLIFAAAVFAIALVISKRKTVLQ